MRLAWRSSPGEQKAAGQRTGGFAAFAAAGLIWSAATMAGAQTVTGSASLTAEAYQQSGLAQGRRPAQSVLAVGTLNFMLAGGVSLPLSFYASSEGSGYQQPFNQFGASPSWGWGTAHAGYFSTQFSELTLQSARLFGGGLELQPGPFRAAAVTGMSQQAVRADSATGRIGVLEQSLQAVQVGFGKPGKALLLVSVLKAEDTDAIGVAARDVPLTPTPQQNLVGGLRFALPIREAFAIEGEVAGSAYSDDTNADSLSVDDLGVVVPSIVRNLHTPRTSSKFDGAGILSLKLKPSEAFSVAFTGRMVGPGYKSLGAPQLESDVRDLTVSPRIQAGRLSMNVTVGQRQNNVANTRESTTSRTIMDASASLQASDALSISTQFTNFGMRAPSPNDTLAIDNISRLASVTPALQFQTGTWTHNLQVSLSMQDYTDRNVLTGQTADNRTFGVVGTHTLIMPGGMTLSTTASDTRGETGGESTVIQSIGESLSMQFFRRKLGFSASGTFSRTVTYQVDTGLMGQLRLNYRIDPRHHQVQFSTSYRRYDFGEPRGSSTGYSEMQTRLGYSLTF